MSEQKPSKWEGAILANNNLQDWIIEDAIDGYCWYDQQRIQRIPGDKALFLHEIAHALCHEEGETGEGFHGGRWANVYQQLVAAEFIALEARLEAMERALQDIAKGMASIPDSVLEQGRSEVTSFMWTYSQRRAREALAIAQQEKEDE